MTESLPSFADTLNHWAFPFIQALRDRRIVNGFPDGTFRPDRPMTRAEYAVILQAALQQPKRRSYTPFIDVGPNFWATPAIIWSYETNFISGFPGNQFRPQANITRIQIIVSLVSGLRVHTLVNQTQRIAPLEQIYQDAATVPQYGRDALHLATRGKLVVNYPEWQKFHPNQEATRAEVAAFFYQCLVLLGKAQKIPSDYIVEVFPAGLISEGKTIIINGKTRMASWNQWSDGLGLKTAIADSGLMQQFGVELLNSDRPDQQPIQWFSNPISLTPQRSQHYRHLNITDWAKQQGWKITTHGDNLIINTGVAQIQQIRSSLIPPTGLQLRISLSQPTVYQLQQDTFEWQITLDATIDPRILKEFENPTPHSNPTPPQPSSEQVNEGEVAAETPQNLRPTITTQTNQILIQGNLPSGFSVNAISQHNPHTLTVEIRPDIALNRNILWLPGLRWRQEYLTWEKERFPVTWLTLSDPGKNGLNLEPIWTYATTMTGTSPLLRMVEVCKSLAGINAGFFNRNNQLPLGAIRWQKKWYSGPILNRGAIAWDNAGNYLIDRLTLQEEIITPSGAKFPLIALNSGYVKGGISRYTAEWGKTYLPLTAGEIIIVVENNQITRHIDSPVETIIPDHGYLLTLRSFGSAKNALPVGTSLTLHSSTIPTEFNTFPHIIGGGPLLLKNQQIVFDAIAEGFSAAFETQSAIRSVLGITPSGDFLLVAIHNRVGGLGATLTETAQLMQQLGAIHALNLDGGSSTSLILGGQMINRPASTAARVHNGLGIFSQQ